MENTLEDQISMIQKVSGGLEPYRVELDVIPVVADYRTFLKGQIGKIMEVATKAGKDITGHTVNKQLKRDEATFKIRMVSTSVVTYAIVKKRPALLERCDASEASLNAMRDNDFYAYAKNVLEEAQPLLPALQNYGLSPNDHKDAEKALEEYFDNIQDPRIQIGERGRHIEELQGLVDETLEFLREKMDKVMELFSVRNPSIYILYKNLRGIDGTGSVKTPDYKGVVAPGSRVVVADLPYLLARTFEIHNLGEASIEFALSTKETEMEGTVASIRPKVPIAVRTSQLNANTAASKLCLYNPGTEPAEYKIYITA